MDHQQSMTDPFMHAYVLEVINEKIELFKKKDLMNCLDIGTGSGYIAFSMYYLLVQELANIKNRISVKGVDLYDKFLVHCNQ